MLDRRRTRRVGMSSRTRCRTAESSAGSSGLPAMRSRRSRSCALSRSGSARTAGSASSASRSAWAPDRCPCARYGAKGITKPRGTTTGAPMAASSPSCAALAPATSRLARRKVERAGSPTSRVESAGSEVDRGRIASQARSASGNDASVRTQPCGVTERRTRRPSSARTAGLLRASRRPMSAVPRLLARIARWLSGVWNSWVMTPAHTGRSSGAWASTSTSVRRTRDGSSGPSTRRRVP